MKKLLLSLAFLMLHIDYNIAQSVTLSADFDLQLGEPYEVLGNKHERYYFPIEEGRAVSIKRIDARMIVQVFDTKILKEIARNDYKDFPQLSTITQSAVERFVQTKNKLYHFLYVYDAKTKEKKMEVRTIDTKTANVSSSKMLFEAPKRAYYTYVKLSSDSSKLLLGYGVAPSKEDNFDGVSRETFYVFDANTLKKEWEKTLIIPKQTYNGKPLAPTPRVKAMSMNNNNTISLLTDYIDKSNLDLYTISKDKVDFKEKLIPLDREIQGLYGTTSNTFLHSLSAEQNNLIFINGRLVVCYSLSFEGKLLASEKHKYPLDFMAQYLNDKDKTTLLKDDKKERAEIEGMRLIATLDRANGGALLIAESQIKELVTSGNSSEYTYHYQNIVLTCLTSDGEIEWTKKIPKKQFCRTSISYKGAPINLGIQCLLSKDKKSAYVFYLDLPENLEIAPDGTPKEFKPAIMGGFLVLCKVNLEDGTYEKHLVADMKDIKGSAATSIEVTNIFHEVENDHVFLMEVRIENHDRLIKITMKK